VACLAACVVVATGCSASSGGSDGAPRTSRVRAAVPPGAHPQSSPQRALEQLLASERRGDFDASYAYVVHPDTGEGPTTKAQWRRQRQDVPRVVEFTVKQVVDRAIATVTHQPRLDPFIGLVPARERQTWTAIRAGDGWLLRPEPKVQPVFPANDHALQVAREWYQAVQRCNEAGAERLQGVAPLFDATSVDTRVCGAAGDTRLEPNVGRLSAGTISGDIVAQYSNSALGWARVAHVVAPVPLSIVLAPIGDTWKVIGIGNAT
jgi:hypothetical protein